jgi:hypothetical protein
MNDISAGPNPAIQVRVQDNLLSAIESFRRGEVDIPTRPEAVRRLLCRALNLADCSSVIDQEGNRSPTR